MTKNILMNQKFHLPFFVCELSLRNFCMYIITESCSLHDQIHIIIFCFIECFFVFSGNICFIFSSFTHFMANLRHTIFLLDFRYSKPSWARPFCYPLYFSCNLTFISDFWTLSGNFFYTPVKPSIRKEISSNLRDFDEVRYLNLRSNVRQG